MAPASNLIGLLQSGASRLQQTAYTHFTLLTAPTAAALELSMNQVTVSQSCTFRSTFTLGHGIPNTNTLFNSIKSSFNGLLELAFDEVLLLVVSYLDGESLLRLQGITKAWRTFIQRHREPLYRILVHERQVFHTVITSRSAFLSYLFSKRHEFDLELAHTHAVQSTHQTLERYCTSTEDHGFVAMFCDIIEFHHPKIAQFVALKRQSALSMVLAATPTHVMKFRKLSNFVGPITFVPVANPLWPIFTLSPVTAQGFVGYAFNLVTVVPGYEALKDTVVKSILKDLMIFDTMENVAAYERSMGSPSYATSLEHDAQAPELGCRLTFSSSLRRQLSKYSVAERIGRLYAKIKAIDDCIAATLTDFRS